MPNGCLSIGLKKDKEWLIIDLPGGEQIEILVKDHNSHNYSTVIIKAPKTLKIKRIKKENFGNR